MGLADEAAHAPTLLNTDPLLIDLTGQGIQVSNWINSPVYFDTNLNASGAVDEWHHLDPIIAAIAPFQACYALQ